MKTIVLAILATVAVLLVGCDGPTVPTIESCGLDLKDDAVDPEAADCSSGSQTGQDLAQWCDGNAANPADCSGACRGLCAAQAATCSDLEGQDKNNFINECHQSCGTGARFGGNNAFQIQETTFGPEVQKVLEAYNRGESTEVALMRAVREFDSVGSCPIPIEKDDSSSLHGGGIRWH